MSNPLHEAESWTVFRSGFGDAETRFGAARRPMRRAAGAKIAQLKHFLLPPSGLNPFFTLNLKKSLGRQRIVPCLGSMTSVGRAVSRSAAEVRMRVRR